MGNISNNIYPWINQTIENILISSEFLINQITNKGVATLTLWDEEIIPQVFDV